MKPRTLLMAAALAGAAWLAMFGDKTADSGVALPAKTPASAVSEAASTRPAEAERHKSAASSAATPQVAILRVVERARYVPIKNDPDREAPIFGSSTWDPPPPKIVAGPPPPPQAPPLPFTYIGKKFQDGVWEVYLGQGESTRVVRPNSNIDGTYAVGAIIPPNLKLTYLPLSQEQTMSIGIP